MSNVKILPFQSQTLEFINIKDIESIQLPLYASYISAGFPSPADDYKGDDIDLLKHLIQNPVSTYVMRVRGSSMQDAKINDGDLLVIDKAREAADGYPIICFVDGDFTVKTFRKINNKAYLYPANPAYKPIEITEGMDVGIWGVVMWILHKPVKA